MNDDGADDASREAHPSQRPAIPYYVAGRLSVTLTTELRDGLSKATTVDVDIDDSTAEEIEARVTTAFWRLVAAWRSSTPRKEPEEGD